MTRNILLPLAALAAACTTAPAETVAASEGARDCIDLSAVTNRAAEDEQTIRFDLIGGETYRNRLAGRCPGLRDASRGFGALAFEPQAGRLCRGDRVRVVDPGRAVSGASIPCVLGDFVPAPNAGEAR